MSLFNVFNVAGSAMSAQTLRLNLTASNLANAETVAGTPETAYKARQPVFAAALKAAAQQGGQGLEGTAPVKVEGVVESAAPSQPVHMPNHPEADANGFVYRSNVNPVEELVNMVSASRSYQNNVEVMNTSKDLLLQTLRLGS
jgi:flagellar basal-body rod protein FlgC